MINQFILDGRNILSIGSLLKGVAALIVTTIAGLTGGAVPAFQVTAPSGSNVWMVTNHGAIGVGTGATEFGSNGDCLKSGGGSGALMSFGTCGGGGSAVTAGQGLTNTSNVFSVSANLTGSTLLQYKTISGSILHADNTLTSSGTLTAKGMVTFQNSKSCTNVQTDSNGVLECNTTTYLTTDQTKAGQGLGMNGTTVSLNTTITGSLVRFTTLSGETLFAHTMLTSSGSLKVLKNISGATLNVNNAISDSGSLSIKGAATFQGTAAFLGTATAPTQAALNNSTKLATTAYVDAAVTASNPAVATQAATAAILPNSPTYSNGVNGIGATLTAGVTNTTLVVDGYTPALNDRILVKNQASAFQNGVYTVTQLSGIGVAWVLTRATDYNQPSDINNTGMIPVLNGTVNVDTSWVLTSKVTTMGTDALNYTQFSYNPAIVITGAAQGLSVINNSLKLNATITGSLVAFQTVSGSVITALSSLNSSGGLVFEGAASGSSLFLGTSLNGAGLTTCSNASTSKLLWNSATGRFSCGTDQTGSASFSSGQVLAIGDARYVKKSGDTMTGALKVRASLSGSTVYSDSDFFAGSSSLSPYGDLSALGLIFHNNSHTPIRITTGIGGTFYEFDDPTGVYNGIGNSIEPSNGLFPGGNSQFLGMPWQGSTIPIFEIGSGAALPLRREYFAVTANGKVEVGSSVSPHTTFDVFGSMSGSSLTIDNTSSLWGALQAHSTLASYIAGNVRIGDTNAAKATLDVVGIASGATVHASSQLQSSGSLIVQGNAFAKGYLSGAQLKIQGLASYILGTVAIGRSSIAHTGDQVEVNGTLSGATIIANTLSGTILRYDIESPRPIMVEPFGSGSNIVTGSGKVEIMVDPVTMSGMKLTAAYANVLTAGTTNATTVQIRDITKGNIKLLTTPINIDSGTLQSRLSSTPPVFAGTVLSGYDTLTVDIPAVSTTAPQGLIIDLIFTK